MSESRTTEATAAFAAALRAMSGVLDELPAKLEGARVHDFAFGKLFEAAEVRDAYHQRLPETEKDLAEAGDVIDHFIAGIEGGHQIAERAGVAETAGVVVAETAGPAGAETVETAETAERAEPVIPTQAGRAGQ